MGRSDTASSAKLPKLASEGGREERLEELVELKTRLLNEIVEEGTRRRKAEDELREAHEEVKRLAEVRTQLLNTVSHELNTPITPIKLQLHLIATGALGELTARQQRALGIVERNVDRLAALVRDVLDMARHENGTLVLRLARMGLNGVVQEALETFDEPAKRKNVRLRGHLASDDTIVADRSRITQVFFNLVSNALKFTPEGGSIDITTSKSGNRAIVDIVDTGHGLTADQIAQLFQPFTQVHDVAEGPAGTGLGLYISKGIIEQHGGEITCSSEGPGRGSTFQFWLPAA